MTTNQRERLKPLLKKLIMEVKSELKESVENQLIKLYKQGVSQAEIASKLNISIDKVVALTRHLGFTVGRDDDEDRHGDDPSSKQYFDRTIKHK